MFSACPSVWSFVRSLADGYQSCINKILKMNEPIVLEIGASRSILRAMIMKWSTFGVRRSNVKVTSRHDTIILDPFGSVEWVF